MYDHNNNSCYHIYRTINNEREKNRVKDINSLLASQVKVKVKVKSLSVSDF